MNTITSREEMLIQGLLSFMSSCQLDSVCQDGRIDIITFIDQIRIAIAPKTLSVIEVLRNAKIGIRNISGDVVIDGCYSGLGVFSDGLCESINGKLSIWNSECSNHTQPANVKPIANRVMGDVHYNGEMLSYVPTCNQNIDFGFIPRKICGKLSIESKASLKSLPAIEVDDIHLTTIQNGYPDKQIIRECNNFDLTFYKKNTTQPSLSMDCNNLPDIIRTKMSLISDSPMDIQREVPIIVGSKNSKGSSVSLTNTNIKKGSFKLIPAKREPDLYLNEVVVEDEAFDFDEINKIGLRSVELINTALYQPLPHIDTLTIRKRGILTSSNVSEIRCKRLRMWDIDAKEIDMAKFSLPAGAKVEFSNVSTTTIRNIDPSWEIVWDSSNRLTNITFRSKDPIECLTLDKCSSSGFPLQQCNDIKLLKTTTYSGQIVSGCLSKLPKITQWEGNPHGNATEVVSYLKKSDFVLDWKCVKDYQLDWMTDKCFIAWLCINIRMFSENINNINPSNAISKRLHRVYSTPQYGLYMKTYASTQQKVVQKFIDALIKIQQSTTDNLGF